MLGWDGSTSRLAIKHAFVENGLQSEFIVVGSLHCPMLGHVYRVLADGSRLSEISLWFLSLPPRYHV